MDVLSLFQYLNYGLVSTFGILLSTHIAGGWETRWQKHLIFTLCPGFILIQSLVCFIFGVEFTHKLYPFIIHLPLVLLFVFALKKNVLLALTSVSTAYLCCQLPNWIRLAVSELSHSAVLEEISYTLIIFPLYYLLSRYFAPTAYAAMTYSFQSQVLFCSLPFVYYLFDYATVIYSDALYSGTPALAEFFPTALIFFYIMFLSAYHIETQKRLESDLHRSMLEAELDQSAAEIEKLRHFEAQASIYRHDLRHHLTAIDGFLSAEHPEQARTYIQQVYSDVEAITPKRFCEHELVNLLCTAFSGKAKRRGVELAVRANVPKTLSIPDTELCALLSNALENALRAVSSTNVSKKKIGFYCELRERKLLIEIKNPYAGKIAIKNGIPVSKRKGHGFGCQSIQNIASRHQGLCSFETNDRSEFVLRVMIPM